MNILGLRWLVVEQNCANIGVFIGRPNKGSNTQSSKEQTTRTGSVTTYEYNTGNIATHNNEPKISTSKENWYNKDNQPRTVKTVNSATTQTYKNLVQQTSHSLTFWRRNYFLNLPHPVYKMWIIQEPNTLDLWNKLHFEEEKTDSIYRV